MSLTGSNADQRVRLNPADAGLVLSHLVQRISEIGGGTAAEFGLLPAARVEETLLDAQDLAFEAGRSELVRAIEDLLATAARTASAAKPESAAGLAGFRDRTRRELGAMSLMAEQMAAGSGVSPADLPPALAARLVGKSGRLATTLLIKPYSSASSGDSQRSRSVSLSTVEISWPVSSEINTLMRFLSLMISSA